MELERLRQIEQLFHVVLEVEQNRQADFLREACGTDESLRREVESLLAYWSRAETFIKLPAMELAARDLACDNVRELQPTESIRERESGASVERWLPAHIGRYRILRVLGEGGMGTVYEAEQEHPRRAVALKVIRPGLISPALLKRFAQEEQMLGRLHHPGVGQVYEGGGDDAGQPFLGLVCITGWLMCV